MAEDRPLRVAVIGGGPAGVTACRLLAEAGHDPVVLEAGSEVGGIWAPEPTNPVVYRGLVTNLPHIVMQSFDLDFPPGLASYITGAQLGDYVVSYADHFDLRRRIRFGAQVTRVRAMRSEAEEARGDSKWRVEWAAERPGEEGGEAQADEFDAVIVASGHYESPYVPEVPGQAAWLAAAEPGKARKVTHAKDYDDPEKHKGRSVIVVGGRSSAVDIARELRGRASWVYVLEKGCQEVRTVGACTHVPFGAELGEDGFVRVGGEVVTGDPVDEIILATGYTYTYPFLEEEDLGLEFGPARRYVAPLYQHCAHARRPSLGFIGVPLAVPCPIPLFEAQARFLAAVFTGRLAVGGCATTAEREAWVAKRKEQVGERSQDLHFLSGNAWDYMKELTRLSGVEGQEYEAYCKRLDTVTDIYQDRCSRRPEMPWDDDTYRRCEYSVDWESGRWEAKPSDAAP